MKRYVIVYGGEKIGLDFCVADRKTMEIAVYPDFRVVVKVPPRVDRKDALKRVANRARWIKKQLDFFRQFEPRTPANQFVSGETHLYLGRQYRLKVRKGTGDALTMKRGYFEVTVSRSGLRPARKVRQLLGKWYEARARDKFEESLVRCWSRFRRYKVSKPRLLTRRMKTRWGSLSKKGTLTLNPDLVRASKPCIDYVVTHELAHLVFHDHGPRFYNLLEQMMPDWKQHKLRLEKSLV